MPKHYGSLCDLSRRINWCSWYRLIGLPLRTSANHEHDLQMGSDQAAELRDEDPSLIRSKILYNIWAWISWWQKGGQTMVKPNPNQTKPCSMVLVLVWGFWNQDRLGPDRNHGLKTKSNQNITTQYEAWRPLLDKSPSTLVWDRFLSRFIEIHVNSSMFLNIYRHFSRFWRISITFPQGFKKFGVQIWDFDVFEIRSRLLFEISRTFFWVSRFVFTFVLRFLEISMCKRKNRNFRLSLLSKMWTFSSHMTRPSPNIFLPSESPWKGLAGKRRGTNRIQNIRFASTCEPFIFWTTP
jgi:hypothetical protein